MSDLVPLADLCLVITKGTTPSASDGGFSDCGVNYIKSESLSYDGSIDATKFTFISEETNQRLKRSIIRDGDILYSIAGANLGKCGIAREEHLPANTNQAVAIIRVDESRASNRFISFYLRNSKFVQSVLGSVAQSAQPNVNLGEIGRFRIPNFPLPEQQAIASVLGALDDKIELNRRMNETLEAMARAIFKDWFVDFGPTRAKMEGRAPYLAPDIWSLFPDRLDDDGKPEGWSVKPLDQVADFLNGLALQKYPANGDASLPAIKIAQLRAASVASADLASAQIPRDYIVENGDVLFSWSGSLLHRVWTAGRGALNQHLFKVTSKQFPKWFFFHWIAEHMPSFQATAASKATTMGHIQRHHLTQALTHIGTPAVMKIADEIIEPLFGRQIANDLESRTLATTRDFLLPKLMSGEVRVKDAEKLVGEAT